MPRLRFLHTADWHLGASWSRLTGRVADLVAWRFEAVRRAYRHADAEKASFIVVAGDVFDSEQPAEKVAAQAADLLNQAPVPLYIIPGNHDPYTPRSIWQRQDFLVKLDTSKVKLCLTDEPIQVAPDCVLLPIPTLERWSSTDAGLRITAGSRSSNHQYRIGLGHGRIVLPDGREQAVNAIHADVVKRAGLDYLALGDFHSHTLQTESRAEHRCYYSGTPECLAIDEERPGHVLLVDFASPGSAPIVTALPTGAIVPHALGSVPMQHPADLAALSARIDAIAAPQNSIVRVDVVGNCPSDLFEQYKTRRDEWRTKFLLFDVTEESLIWQPSTVEVDDLMLDENERQLLSQLGDGNALLQWLNDFHPTADALKLLGHPEALQEAQQAYLRMLQQETAR